MFSSMEEQIHIKYICFSHLAVVPLGKHHDCIFLSPKPVAPKTKKNRSLQWKEA